jgi:hypothetical protein
MHGSRSKIPSKNVVIQRCAEGFNSGVKHLIQNWFTSGTDNKHTGIFRQTFIVSACMKRNIIVVNGNIKISPL